MAKVTIDFLRSGSEKLLSSWGVPAGQARLIADTIVYAHRREKHTHGIIRLPIYKMKIDRGLMMAKTKCRVISDFAAISTVDCQNGFGQVVADFAMRIAVDKARQFGIGAVFVRNSNNFGVAGYFGEIAANAGMVGMVMTAAAPAIAPEGGLRPIFGTNPYCYAFPYEHGNIVLDMAVSAAARGKIRLALKNGEKIPFGWAVDKDGNPTDDPVAALEGNMLAIGGVKGFGLSLVADILGGLLSGSAFGGGIRPLADRNAPSRHGHFFTAINVGKLMSASEYAGKMSMLVANVKACGEIGRIFLPGERAFSKEKLNYNEVELKQKQVDDFVELLKRNGIVL